MSLLSHNKTFYPTPSGLAGKMIGKIRGNPVKALEPSAGKGDLIEHYSKRYEYTRRNGNPGDISAIEIDEELQATLRGKGIKVIDSDFLAFAGPDKFDLIIANPPFDEGDKHLLKVIEIVYCGEIIFLLNAETIRNPHTNTRKELAKELKRLGAEIEYIPNAFMNAERQTSVEVALVYINVQREVEADLFDGAKDKAQAVKPEVEDRSELTTGRAVEDMVAEYNEVVRIGIETLVEYFKRYNKIGKYISVSIGKESGKYSYRDSETLTIMMQTDINELLVAVRTSFWRRTLELKDVKNRLTSKKRDEFEHQITKHCDMDFTANNIRQFVLNLIGGHEKTLTEAVLDIFDMFTKRHCFSDGLYDDNVHMFSGWKTNKAFRVGKRVIIPIHGSYGSPWIGWSGRWELNHGAAGTLQDIDIVMNYFDGMSNYLPMCDAIREAFKSGRSSKIHSTYFTITVYKKGTVHLTFNDEDILRRFNVVACKGKQWLPHDYGTKTYEAMDLEERAVVNEFEGTKSYTKNRSRPLFAPHSNQLQLTA